MRHGPDSSPRNRILGRMAAVIVLLTVSLGGFADVASATPGASLWVARFGTGSPGVDSAHDVAVSNNRVFVTGTSEGPGGIYDYATVAYNLANGNEIWHRRYDGPAPGQGQDAATSIAVSPDGTQVFVTGFSQGTTSTSDYTTVAYDASNGAALWPAAVRYDGPGTGDGEDEAYSIAVRPDGKRVFVTGFSDDPSTLLDYATVAYDTSDGSQFWARRYDGTAGGVDRAASLAVAPDGSKVFVTGSSEGKGSPDQPDYATVAYNTQSGAKLWDARYDAPAPGNQSDEASSIAVRPNSQLVYVTGSSKGSSSGYDFATVAYRATNGQVKWTRRFSGNGQGWDAATSIAANGAKVFVTGMAKGWGTGYDYVTLAYEAVQPLGPATAAPAWTRRYDGPGHKGDGPSSIAVSPDGTKVFVTGQSFGAGSIQDYATMAYNTTQPSGALNAPPLWVSRYPPNGTPDTDFAYSLAVSHNGTKVFVTGESPAGGNGITYTTVAYSA